MAAGQVPVVTWIPFSCLGCMFHRGLVQKRRGETAVIRNSLSVSGPGLVDTMAGGMVLPGLVQSF